ncbi:DUF6528 family protein [Kribbella shirazensis]|uniref:WD40 repeat domain-containing protein n=1 Tax=Kribbella shirazensis TaxID=1105143 RepID=A0A7X5ZY39_9ACTN|nr:hypothetical protein [Kribbella shirazensis]
MGTAAAAAAAVMATAGLPMGGTGADADGAGGRDSSEQIVVTEQATDQILVLDSDRDSWQNTKIAWSWRPTAQDGLGDLVDNWGAPDEAKLRHRGGQAYLLTTDSWGLAAVVPYPQKGPAYWAADVERKNNPHSIELLPDGNVAVVASHGNWLRLYTASQGQRSTTYVEFPLADGHGVYWDADTGLLWALGGHDLVALRVGGTPAAPTLTETKRVALPTLHGHDLQPVARDRDRFWITTGSQVYQYSKSRNAFLQDYVDRDRINVTGVKSVGDEATSGQILTSVVQVKNLCTWCTDTPTLTFRRDQLTLHGSQIYKARWWVDPTLR